MQLPTIGQHIGAHISAFCRNGVIDDRTNHCAHYVCHALGLDIGFTCRNWRGGSHPGAGLRVHEIFAACPRVEAGNASPPPGPCLVFVTRPENVDLPHKRMRNVPRKHVGIFSAGQVFHYDNNQNQVVCQPITDFLACFQQRYGPGQALYYGSVPGSNLRLNVQPNPAGVRGKAFRLLPPQGGRHYAQVEGEDPFYIGSEMRYGARRGLGMSPRDYYGPTYDIGSAYTRIDHWAVLIDLIAACESRRHFNAVNAYDRAGFTFGLCQLGAHTPGDNLVLLFRRLLELPEASAYYPDLALRDGRVHRVDTHGSTTDLEQDAALRTYLNPDATQVNRQQLLHAARLIHWSNTSDAMRDAQVQVTAEILMRKVDRTYARWYSLDGMPDTAVALICDIHHQGRARRHQVADALAADAPEEALMNLGRQSHPARVAQLRAEISRMKAHGLLGKRSYDTASNGFVYASPRTEKIP
ncbi:MAG: hypothetical protein IT368_08105 [Candidatus Hydrogenedentes bacterium]|nr:hypothetical protein [Candidatus Hydrogenedentota bacterium]